jgi:hypothetical protein
MGTAVVAASAKVGRRLPEVTQEGAPPASGSRCVPTNSGEFSQTIPAQFHGQGPLRSAADPDAERLRAATPLCRSHFRERAAQTLDAPDTCQRGYGHEKPSCVDSAHKGGQRLQAGGHNTVFVRQTQQPPVHAAQTTKGRMDAF